MGVDPDFKTKKALREAVLAGKSVYAVQVGPVGKDPVNCECSVEGPQPRHMWYARVRVNERSKIVEVIS